MTETEFSRRLSDSFVKNSLPEPDSRETAAFWILLNELTETNKVMNLTAITEPDEIISKHFVDSLLGSEEISSGSTVLDLGCGAGFPSLPLAICRPDLSIISLDSTAKKIAFVQKTAEKLQLSNLKTIVGRAEDPAIKEAIGKPNVIVSRAVARLNLLCELAFPLLPVGGLLFAMKGAKGEEELEEASKAIKLLGGGEPILQKRSLILSNDTSEERSLILIPKIKATPSGYPRPFATMRKKPL
ncbi:MAG: 16S rRNA (guanine(527)-N(7))-methyltransferase RsmG [Clostridia bacterium]|nr:16S rRNA (guanine(527)-N(7))-methyltransferase RsmG [Clostridia bacterium]